MWAFLLPPSVSSLQPSDGRAFLYPPPAGFRPQVRTQIRVNTIIILDFSADSMFWSFEWCSSLLQTLHSPVECEITMAIELFNVSKWNSFSCFISSAFWTHPDPKNKRQAKDKKADRNKITAGPAHSCVWPSSLEIRKQALINMLCCYLVAESTGKTSI